MATASAPPVGSSTKPVRGSLLAMPLIVLNMGAEMVYILEQRLKAQSISGEKSKRVLADVLRTMFSNKFVVELMRSQEAYTSRSTRQIFDRLAHSSIMKLNKTSMDKLFDLMTMSFKFQVTRVSTPSHMLSVTLTHCESLTAILRADGGGAAAAGGSPDKASATPPVSVGPIIDLIDAAARVIIDTYSSLPPGEAFALRHTLARFFQDRRVKVSLFLQDGLQNMDGSIVIDTSGPVPAGSEPPGIIRYFDPYTGARLGTDKAARLVVPTITAAIADSNQLVTASRPTRLGENMYAKERKAGSAVAPAAGPDAALGVSMAASSSRITTDPRSSSDLLEGKDVGDDAGKDAAAASKDGEGAGPGHGRAALDLLASMLRGGGESKEDDAFKFSLFAGDGGFAGAAGLDDVSTHARPLGMTSYANDIISFDAGDVKRTAEMLRRLGMEDGKTDGADGKDDDDLLSMMDAAVGSK